MSWVAKLKRIGPTCIIGMQTVIRVMICNNLASDITDVRVPRFRLAIGKATNVQWKRTAETYSGNVQRKRIA